MTDWTPDELKGHLDQGTKVFVKLWKKGCGVCKLSEPATDRMEKKNPYGMTFARISVDEYPEMLEVSGTEVLPAFFVFADKEKKGHLVGFKGLKKLEEFVASCFES